MRRLPLAVMLALAAAGGSALPFAAARAQQSAPADRQALGRELARINNDEKTANAQIDGMLRSVAGVLAQDADMQALEKEHPGAIQLMVDAMAPVIREEILRTLPDLWERLGVLYAKNLTEAELREVIAFYSSPLGDRLRAAMGGSFDAGPMLREVMANPDAPISQGAMRSTLGKTAVTTVRTLSPEDQKALAQFAFTPAGSKFVQLSPETIRIATEWTNAPSPELDAKLEKITEEVVTKILEKEQSK